MADSVNMIIGFLLDQWLIILPMGVAAILLLLLALRLVAANRAAVAGRSAPFHRARAGAGVPEPERERKTTHDERARFLAIAADLRADNEKLQEQIRDLRNRAALLGPLMKELNANVDRGMIAPLVERVLDRTFAPVRIVVYVNEGDPDLSEELTCVLARGVEGLARGTRLDPGLGEGGFLGLVGRKRVPLCRRDRRFESNLVRRKVAETESEGSAVEMAVPVVYRNRLLGILGISEPREGVENALELLGMIAEMTALALANYLQFHKIQQLANSDPLTGLYNKGYFLDICDRMVREALGRREPLAILMFDVDNFKHYNDTNGHLAGDRLLRRLAELIRSIAQDRGLPARFGGEEFIIAFHGGPAEAREMAEQIRAAVERHSFEHCRRQPLGFLSLSGGVASLLEDGETVETLIGAADAALYHGKRTGRNCIVTASDLDRMRRAGVLGAEEPTVEIR